MASGFFNYHPHTFQLLRPVRPLLLLLLHFCGLLVTSLFALPPYMAALQLLSYGGFDRSSLFYSNDLSSSFWGRDLCLGSRCSSRVNVQFNGSFPRVFSMLNGAPSPFKMNLNEYMITLEKPLGIRFALSIDGKIFVHALKRGGNAEKSRIIMVGDTLKKASESSGGKIIQINNLSDTQKMLKEKSGSFSLVLERPFSTFPIQQLLFSDFDTLFNRGRVPIASWNKNVIAPASTDSDGNSGFAVFSSKFSTSQGWNTLNQNEAIKPQKQKNSLLPPIKQLISIFSEEESGDGEWGHGSFPLEEYTKALDRSKGELYYDHFLGMRYSKITEQIYVGSCIQTEADVETLAKMGVTAVLNFQSGVDAENWGIDSKLINESCQRSDVLMVNYPIREGDSYDLRKKLPFCVGLLLRLLKKSHRVFITCTTGFDRSPSCVVAYLHWMTDTSLQAAYNFVTSLHICKPDRPAIAWATWDLIALVEKGRHDGPATHAVTFVWNGQEGEEVNLVGDFTGNWKEPVRATHKGGPRYEVELRLSQGKYNYKYIVNGQWRHSISSPAERDERGNVNNVIEIGDTASVRPADQQHKKDANILKVIERPLTENERFMLAKAARCIAFSVCPIKLAPK